MNLPDRADTYPLKITPGPHADLVHPLRQRDADALRASIAKDGVLVPVEVDEDGVLLDGHHRHQFATELGVDCPYVVIAGLTAEQKFTRAISVNLERRQLASPQVEELIVKLRDQGLSTRAIAEKTGVSQSKVARSVRKKRPSAMAETAAPAGESPDSPGEKGPEETMSRAEAQKIVDAYVPKRGRPPAAVAQARRVLSTPEPTPVAAVVTEPERITGRDGRSHPAKRTKRAPAAHTPVSVLNKEWIQWVGRAESLIAEGALLAARTDVDLAGHAAFARMIYQRMAERFEKFDAEVFDAELHAQRDEDIT